MRGHKVCKLNAVSTGETKEASSRLNVLMYVSNKLTAQAPTLSICKSQKVVKSSKKKAQHNILGHRMENSENPHKP